MREIRRDLDLVQEPLLTYSSGQFWPQDLDRHFAVVFEIFGEVNRGHASGTQLAINLVAICKGRSEPLDWITHRVLSAFISLLLRDLWPMPPAPSSCSML